jgi:dienelactone hydrolase
MLSQMALFRHLSALALALSWAAPAAAQQPAAAEVPAEGPAAYAIFLRGQQIGREEARLARTPDGWRITSSSNLTAGAVQMDNRLFEVRYASDWHPIELRIEGTVNGKRASLNTSFGLTNAVNEITSGDTTNQKTDVVSARAIVLPNNFYAAYEALAARLSTADEGTRLPIYVAPQAEITARVESVVSEQVQTTAGTFAARRFRLTFQNPSGPLPVDIWVDSRGRLARLEITSASLQVVREELASAMTRFEAVSHPGDEPAMIPASGFNLAATVTRPVGQQQKLRLPAVILVPGSGQQDRNETVVGIPIFGQIANALADAGFLVIRYDKRGVAQSGGRSESATLQDYSEDLRAVVRYARKRRDVDARRVALLGHSEGAWVALLAASKEDDIAALVMVAGAGTTGAELVLEQQRHLLERSKVPEPERVAKIELQKKINTAVMTGRGWDEIPENLRAVADSPWFKSVLSFEPSEAMEDAEQPILIVQGVLDTQVKPHHAEKLAALARERDDQRTVDVRVIDGVNHLLVPARTGEIDEYSSLEEKKVSRQVIDSVIEWLREKL